MLPRASFLVRDHYSTLLVDLRGHGGSGGNSAGPGYLEALDILGAVSYLRRRDSRNPIVAMGHSYGAVAAIYAAAQSQDIAAVIADSAFISFADMRTRATTLLSNDPDGSFAARVGLRLADSRAAELAVLPIFYLRTGVWVDRRKSNALLAIPRIGQHPILFIAGERDEICPLENTRHMYDAAFSPHKSLLIVPDASHDSTFTSAPQLYESAVVRFLEEAL
jgi:pimeloyl-ACP methyl ester carboxylesterase